MSTAQRREARKAKKEATRKKKEDKKTAEEQERLRRETPKYKRDEKRQKLLGQLEEVKSAMNDNIDKSLKNYGTTKDLEAQSASLMRDASTFQRVATRVEARAYWDAAAKKIYIGLISLGILCVLLGLLFKDLDVCQDQFPPLNHELTNKTSNETTPTPYNPEEAWIECPSYWMAMLVVLDIILIGMFWWRKKICCCWCDVCRLGRCECCQSCPVRCCKECGK